MALFSPADVAAGHNIGGGESEFCAARVIDHGREGDPSITLVGPILQVDRLVMEADRQLTRWRIDNSPRDLKR